jgi:protein-L-isoaspartate(D-aspartate) O-methyltransferase
MCSSGIDPNRRRALLVDRLRASGELRSTRVLAAFAEVPRHLFVPPSQAEHAYEDRALALQDGQTISQPTMIAIMLEALECRPTDRALEVGAGCGYAAALLARLVAHVDAVEIRSSLARAARLNLAAAGVTNVAIHEADGQHGLAALAPFQRILVSAGAPRVSPQLLDQLAPGGRVAVPVDAAGGQVLQIGERSREGAINWRSGVRCRFVPLVTDSQ